MKHPHRGFTLLEVMAAIVIMALACTMLLKALGASTALTHKAAMRTHAATWGQSLLDSVYAVSPPVPGTHTGRFNDTYRWRLDVTPWHAPRTGSPRKAVRTDSGVRLYALDLAVMWGKAPRQHVLHLATLRAVRADPRAGSSP